MALQDLEAKYFDVRDPAAAPEDMTPPVYRGTTVVTPIIDGADYLPEVHAAISATAAGDAVYLVGWRFNPKLDLLDGSIVELSSPRSIGNLLAVKAAQGVDVRLVLNGTLALYWVPVPWAESLRNAESLRELRPPGSSSPPLAQRVLFDWSGANQTGSQHQKAVVVRRGTDVAAFVGGMDMNPNLFDKAPHEKYPIPAAEGGGMWGWHDFGVKLEGEAAKHVLHNFRCRWEEASTLPEKLFKWRPGDQTESPRPFNPPPILATPAAVTATAGAPANNHQSVQVLRSRFKWKIPNRCGSGGAPWSGLPDEPATGGFFEIYNTMKKAIAAATRYIYIEDQFLDDSLPGGQSAMRIDDLRGQEYSLFTELLNALNAPNAFTLRLIFVGSGRKDPEDPGSALRNLTITPSVRRIIDGLPDGRKGNVAVWRRDKKTVHSKLMIIDDEFMSVGSANFQSRSMAGLDNEIQVAIVAEDDLIKEKRKALWIEHFMLEPLLGVPGVQSGLDDIDTALGLWGDDWYVPNQSYWENRTGYNMVNGFGGLSPVLL
jgi:phosphatidylserine/phosphatidylglycerophosphate/cardiolipin synthase-like enzyme